MSNASPQLNEDVSNVTQKQEDLLEQLLKPEVQESLSTLITQLPKLAEMVTLLTKAADLVQAVSKDEVLKNDTVSAVKEIAGPVVGSVKGLAAAAIEAKDRAAISNEQVGLFGMLKMLKDPQVQSCLRFANAFLQVRAEQANNK